ncbi:MAG: RNA 2',3'-cyclic phosphodiesterase [Planctomycetia bacterium]|nr:RNA 2',3'-cyclic phosphodiesterase [Planctomycetia bacterium]
MKATTRTFIALDISSDVRSRIRKAVKPLREIYPEIKWVNDEQFHITLKFLGDVPTLEIHEIIAAAERAAAQCEIFDLIMEKFGVFPDRKNPKTLWVGIGDGIEELRSLVGLIENELAPLGFPRDPREFTPHLTVGRVRQTKFRENERRRKPDQGIPRTVDLDIPELTSQEDLFFGCCSVDEIIVYGSELQREGPLYEVLGSVPLQG